MGVPAFFRYISERYPCLSEVVKEYQVPDFDNMYLDMNGIIHTCSHPDDSNPHFRITEEKIFQDIFHYIDMLYQLIKPRKLFFMAIDGVAPRAKMNQQRGRRFRSAREAEKLEKRARENGESLPKEKRFDSNCITPGTVFMARLHEQLRYFIRHKITTDPTWAKCKFVLSGHETPGEGEHKIMDYIRFARSQPDYDPNTKHCLYGLDADLIMLGLCTHEPHFSLLREEVKFGKKSSQHRTSVPEETTFFLLHLSLLRDYLEQEFISLKTCLTFNYDLDKIIDDWVLMGFIVGNDFIPNLPHMHINSDALPILYKTYMKVLPSLTGYINEAGILNLPRFQAFMGELANIDRENFHDIAGDLKYFEDKTGRKFNSGERKSYKYVPDDNETFGLDVTDIKAKKPMEFGFGNDLQNLINKTDHLFVDKNNVDYSEDEDYVDISEDDDDLLEAEFISHKTDYYKTKLDYSDVTEDVLRNQAECYVTAIQWNLHYYYHGCVSWSWFYPHHYAPYISDITNFENMDIKYDMGQPFRPFEQLLAVLPAASKDLLPIPFRDLMVSEKSPIFEYYPVNFETDLNGKKNEWEAVVLIPFIEEAKLLSAMAPCYKELTEEELKINSHGPMLIYKYSPNNLGDYEAPQYFPTIKGCHAFETKVWREELFISLDKLKKGPLPNKLAHKFFPGFPTLKHLNFKSQLLKKAVKVFDQPSRNDNMILEVIQKDNLEVILEQVAANFLGKVVWVGWPHLIQAKVISVSNKEMRIHYTGEINDTVEEGDDKKIAVKDIMREANQGSMLKQWNMERSTAVDHNMTRMGIDLGDVRILIHAVNLKGYRYCPGSPGNLTMGREWCKTACSYALQTVIPKLDICSPEQIQKRYSSVQDAFKTYDKVFIIGKQYYGCMATVVNSSHASQTNRIKISIADDWEPVVNPAASGIQFMKYLPGHHVSARCGISSHLLSRITGHMFVFAGNRTGGQPDSQKFNIGLNLKNNKKNEEVTGYTKRCNESQMWLYSTKCRELLEDYVSRYPDIFARLTSILNNENFYESDLFPGEVGQDKLKELAEWVSRQPHSSAPRRICGSNALEPSEIVLLSKAVDAQLAEKPVNDKPCTLQVKINILFKPELHFGILAADPKAEYKLYDRVVSVSTVSSVPLGLKGTVVGIEPQKSSLNSVKLSDKLNAEVTYIILFDKSFPGGLTCEGLDDPRLYRLQGYNLLNISYGRKTESIELPDNKNGFSQQDNACRFQDSLTMLRPNGGHQSAFACYSPTKDKQGTPLISTNQPPPFFHHSFSQPPPPFTVLSPQTQQFKFNKPPPVHAHYVANNSQAYPPSPNRGHSNQTNHSDQQYQHNAFQNSNRTNNRFNSGNRNASQNVPGDESTNMLRAMLNIQTNKRNTPQVRDPFAEESPLVENVANFIQDHANVNADKYPIQTRTFHNSRDKAPQSFNNFGVNKAPDSNWRQRTSPPPQEATNWRKEVKTDPVKSAPYTEIADGLIDRNWSSNIKQQDNVSNFSRQELETKPQNLLNNVPSDSLRNQTKSDELAAAGRKFQKAMAQITMKVAGDEKKNVGKSQNATSTPFVPLQAVTNQRKNQGISNLPKNQPQHQPTASTQNVNTSKTVDNPKPQLQTEKPNNKPPIKKKKSRIAANFSYPQ